MFHFRICHIKAKNIPQLKRTRTDIGCICSKLIHTPCLKAPPKHIAKMKELDKYVDSDIVILVAFISNERVKMYEKKTNMT